LTWTETSQQDLNDGQFESNLFASFRFGGTVEFAPRFDLNNDGWMDLVCSEGYGSSIRVYFGDSSGFSPSRSRVYTVPGGGGCDIADLNYDGYADLVHSGWRARNTGTIYWGTDSGPDPADTTELPARTSEATTTADIDADGYLDIVFSSEDGISYIYWGSTAGYSPSNVMLLNITTDNGHNWVTADLDKDGYTDLLTCCCNSYTRQPIFYFGPNRTYRTEWLDFSVGGGFNAQGVTVADLDHNGWLDIVYTGHNNITQAWVYWGSDSGFTFQKRTVLNTDRCFGGSAAYDFDKDGLLDLLFFRGSYYSPSQFKPIIYYNMGSFPYFSDAQSSTIGNLTMNSTGGRVADFNNDGNVDIYFDDFRPSDSAKVFWGPDWNGVTELPCYSGHHGMARAIGNIYDRSYREDYVSSVFDGTTPTNWHTVSWDDSTPSGSFVEVAVRTGATAAPDSTWGGWYAVANGDTLPDSLDSRYIQYRATLKYQNPASLPMLFEVRIDYGPGLAFDVGPTAILVPVGTVDSGTQVTPTVVVRNFGTGSATFPTTLLIGSGYSETQSDTLAAGSVDTLRFPIWTAYPIGTTGVVCFTGLVGDEDPANDTIRDSVRVVGPPVHDVGAVAIISPSASVRAGDTVVPRALIRNFGNRVERFFNVRFRIGTGYNRTATEAQTLYPDSVVELTFAPWVADSGVWAVSCSTMLASDVNRANDKVTSTVRAFAQLLHIEPDQSDRLEVGQGKTYQFRALIEGDTGGVVEVARPTAPVGWSVRLCDPTGTNDLADTDADGIPDLGYVAAGETSRFSLEVQTPSGLAGDTASLTQRTFVVAGNLGSDSMVADTALLNLTLVPGFSVHNFPNPFSDHTTFVIGLPDDGKASLTVYTRAGERVCRVLENADMPAGVHFVRWDGVNDNGRSIAPGTYEYLLDYVHAGKTDRIRKRLVLTRQ